MSFDIESVKNQIRDLAKKEQQKQILEGIIRSDNQPKFPETDDIDILYNFVSNLPEASKYNILYDPKSTDASTSPAMEKPENKAILDGLNKKLRQNQLDTINSAKNVEFKGVIKVLIEELPNIVLRHISAHVSEHITVQIQTANMHTHSATVGSIPIV